MQPAPKKCLVVIVCSLVLMCHRASARIFPEEGATLNYRIVGFSFPSVSGIDSYKIEIAPGNINDQSVFKAIVTSASSTRNRVVSKVPSFGALYTWRVVYEVSGKETKKSELYHFSTGSIPQVDTANTRLRVTLKKNADFHSYVMLNGSRTMYDTDGEPVWYLPDLNGFMSAGCDVKCTPQHTITMLYGRDALEVNYNGKVLWKAPAISFAKDSADRDRDRILYHHEFTRLSNGHYMVLGSKNVTKTAGKSNENRYHAPNAQFTFFPKIFDGMLYEFDAQGNIVWSWKSSDYYAQSDLYSFYTERLKDVMLFGHENSFYFDEQQQVIYLSYAAFNRIVKISYPSGKVLNTYGTILKAGSISDSALRSSSIGTPLQIEHMFQNDLFLGQHSCRKTKSGDLILFNNNLYDTGISPQVLILKEPAYGETGGLKKEWEYDCSVEDLNNKQASGGGGSVYEMQDGSLFVSMNFPYGKIFVIDKNKKMLWIAHPERRVDENKWDPLAPYRASIIDQADLEQLIWHSEGLD